MIVIKKKMNEDEIYDMLENEDMLADRINLCYSDTGVPEYKREEEYPYWEDTLYYLLDENEENIFFAKKLRVSDNGYPIID